MTEFHLQSRERAQLWGFMHECRKLAARGRVGVARTRVPSWSRSWNALPAHEQAKLAGFVRTLVPLLHKQGSWFSSLVRGAGAAGKAGPTLKGMDFIRKSTAHIRGMSPLGKASLAIAPAISGYQYYQGQIGPGEALAGSLVPFGTAHLGLVPSLVGFMGAGQAGSLVDQLAGTAPVPPAPVAPAAPVPQMPLVQPPAFQPSLTPNQLALYTGGGGVTLRPELTMQGQMYRKQMQESLAR